MNKTIEDLIDLLSGRTCLFCGLYKENNKCYIQSDGWLSDCIEGHCDDWRPRCLK